ncbi:Rod shape-determining protein MreB [bacterium HR34]|nr:Rod shape-determining protein MreB [bacterium HR34]
MKFLSKFSKDIAIDLGTATTLVYVKGEGIVITEPSVVALSVKTGKIVAIGREAKEMVGRTPAHIVAKRPLKEGVISDFEVTEQMLKYFIEKVYKGKVFSFLGPRVIVGIPSNITEVEKKAVKDAAISAGAREVYLIEQPMAAAIGARLPVQEATGNFIVDIGGGTTDIAVISLGGLVLSNSIKIAGDKLTSDIIHFVQERYNLAIGEITAEEVKIKLGSAWPTKETKTFPLRGRNIITGLPEEILISDKEIREAMSKSIKMIIDEIKAALDKTPPELIADIMVRGIYLTGGGALLKGLDKLLSEETKMPVNIIDDPLTAVVRGAGIVIENIDKLRDVLAEEEELQPPKD